MKYTITARYGSVDTVHHSAHTGIDFAFPFGTEVHSIHSGVVERITHYGDYNIGNGIIVKWDDVHTAIFGHLSKINVHEGQHVQPGDLLGLSGNSGHSTGAHLHFGLKENGHFVDPSEYIPNIQHMNDPTQIAVNHGTNVHDYAQSLSEIYSNLSEYFKLHFINFIHSIDYSMFIQHFKNLLDIFF